MISGWELFLKSWEFHPSVVAGCIMLLAAYLIPARCVFNSKTIMFVLGVLTIFLALVSPIDTIGDDYLFSAHMVQHMMLGIIAPVFIVTGIPQKWVLTWLKSPTVAKVESIFSRPDIALFLANGTFWVWHLPSLYNLTLQNEGVHIAEHLMFMVTGTMLWWPVFKPIPQGRLSPLGAFVYLSINTSLCSLLGIIFTVSDTPYYAGYAHPNDELGALSLIRDRWGLTQIADQKLGGALMWEPAGAIFLWAMMVVMLDWFKRESKVESLEKVTEEQR
jgi:cytochrome c oxidase assembly factor CtaG